MFGIGRKVKNSFAFLTGRPRIYQQSSEPSGPIGDALLDTLGREGLLNSPEINHTATNEPRVQKFDDLLFPGVVGENWQMMPWEKIALTGILARLRPKRSLEIGIYHGGSLSLTSQFVEKVYAIDIDPAVVDRFEIPPNAEIIIGNSVDELPRLFKTLDERREPLEFILIDADHSADGVRKDIEAILKYRPIVPCVLLLHDSGNPECRRGIKSASWNGSLHVHHLDLDFVPAQIIEGTIRGGVGEVWGGFAAALLLPEVRTTPLSIQEGAATSGNVLRWAAPILGKLGH